MNPEEYRRMHALETQYWWFVGRRAIIARLLCEAIPRVPGKHIRLLDIGCGTGANLPMLSRAVGTGGEVVGMDFSPLALEFASQDMHLPNVVLTQGDALRLPIQDGSCQVVTMLDVLEHLSDDGRALQEVNRVLAPGGALVLSVPAYQHLWSAHDEALHHFRRYEKSGLALVLRSGGFNIWRLSFAMSLMPPLAWGWRKFVLPHQPRRPKDAQRHSEGAVLPNVPGWANGVLVRYVETEGRVIARKPLRFGTSLVAVVFKPQA